jgi:hypothetical protein
VGLAGPALSAQPAAPAAGTSAPEDPRDSSPAKEALREVLKAPEFSAREKVWRLKPRPRRRAQEPRAHLSLAWLETAGAVLKYLLLGIVAWVLGYAVWSRRDSLRRALLRPAGAAPEPAAGWAARGPLPADLAAAAQALWDRGEPRGALALLYRGALVRLELGEGATEKECLHAAAPLPQAAYLARLLRAWQEVAYAGLAPDPAQRALCADWAGQFPAAGSRP